MATRFDARVLVLAGSRDGLYLFESDGARRDWRRRGPFLEGREVNHATLDPRDGRTIWAAATGHGVTGVFRSPDRGDTWEPAGRPFDADQVWHVEPGHADHPGRLYAGVRPAALYQSDDRGASWREVGGLNQHPSSDEWWEGGAGKVLHTIVTNPRCADELHVGISVAGVFRSCDGGASWTPSNDGIVAMADTYEAIYGAPARHAVHACVHKLVRHPEEPSTLYQQNHDGVYRSDDNGANWTDISAGLPSRFGFVITAARDGAVYVVPQDAEQIRFSGQLTVYRTRDRGATWQPLSQGLPEIERLTLYREGMAADCHTPGGVYFGSSAGDLFHTRDGGETWATLASGLPPIRSVACEHFG